MTLAEFLFRLASDPAFRREYKESESKPEFLARFDLDADAIEYLRALDDANPCEIRGEVHVAQPGDECGGKHFVFAVSWLH